MSVRIINADVMDGLAQLDDESVQCVVTSPPYWGLRDYGVDGQIGLEKTPAEFVARMVEVFEEVRRVLRKDGVCFVNLGDSYAGSWGAQGRQGETGQMAGRSVTKHREKSKLSAAQIQAHPQSTSLTGSMSRTPGLKPKDLIGIPWRVALAMQQPRYTGRIKNLEDRVWLAAIIDGEGCFFIHKRKAGTPSYSKYTRADGTETNYTRTADTYGVGLEISNTSKRLIDRVAEIVPGGTFTTQSPDQNGRRKQTIYRWRLAPNEAKRLAQELYPHLVAKQHQARLIFSCPSTGDAGAAAHQAMMDLHNGSQTDVDFPEPPSLFSPGWYLRGDYIWGKPNPMPESVTDRCTKSHEYIFHFSKSERYFWDQAAIRESAMYDGPNSPGSEKSPYGQGFTRRAAEERKRPVPAGKQHKQNSLGQQLGGALGSNDDWLSRNKRSVWSIATAPFPEAHFATFPPELPEICIKAGSKPGDTILDPFGGAGTTGLVADRLQRNAILIELNPAYAAMATARVEKDRGPLLSLLEGNTA